MSKKDGGAGAIAAQTQANEQARQAQIQQGTDQINNTFDSQFTPDFYQQQYQNYMNYAQPQLDQQYADAQKQLTYSLARGGNLDSSARAAQDGVLQRTYDQNAQQIADQATAYKTQAQNNVEDARSNLISMLNSTGDATGAANQAVSRAASLSVPPAYSTLSNLFADFTNTLGGAQAQAQANYYANGGAIPNNMQTNLFTPNPGAVAVKGG